MGRLNEAGIPVYLLFGNHDAESEMTKKLLMPLTFTFSRPAVRAPFASMICGSPCTGRASGKPQSPRTWPPVPGWLNVGVLRTALEGYAAHASYVPCSLPHLAAKG
jgi:DNA repair protein SbcD/Mre11